MAKQLVARMECDRCKSVWYVDHAEGDELPATPSLLLEFLLPGNPHAERIASYTVLCQRCTKAVHNYASHILKVDPIELEGSEEEAEDPRLTMSGKAGTAVR